MSVEEVTMYRVACDHEGCGAHAEDDTDYSAWGEADHAVDMAREGDWLVTDDGRHYCGDHQKWDDDADEIVGVS